jgi:hypothetical protein
MKLSLMNFMLFSIRLLIVLNDLLELRFPKILMEGWTICYEISCIISAQSNDRIEYYAQ